MSSLDLVVDELKKQNQTLEDTKASIQKMLSEDIAARKARERRVGVDEENRREARQQRASGPSTFKEGLVKGVKDATGFSLLEQIGGWGKAVLAGLFGGATAGAIAGTLGQLVSRGAIFAGAGYLVGKFGEDLFTKLFDELDPNDVLSDATKKELSASLTTATRNGLYGLILGKKAGIAAFVGSLIGDGLTKLFGLSETERMKIFGYELPVSEADFAGYGSMIAAYFGPSLIGAALNRAFTGQDTPAGATVGRDPKTGKFTKLKPQFRKTFMANFKPRMGWAAVIGTAGALLANYIGDMTGSQELGDVANWTTMGASFGMMFGPQGALIGALLGFTFAAGSALIEKLGEMRKENLAKINAEIDKLQAEAQKAADTGDYETASTKLAQAGAEQRRLAELTTQAIGSKQGIETAEARVDLSEFEGMSKGQKVNAAIELFSQTMKSQLADNEKITKATRALTLYSQVTGVSRQQAIDELIGELGAMGPAQGRALNLRSAILSNAPAAAPAAALSSRLDRKGSTIPSGTVPDGGGKGAPAVVINAPQQNSNVNSSTTVSTDRAVPARDTVDYAMP